MTTLEPLTSAHPAFGQVAALFDDYRAHAGWSPAATATRVWLQEQFAQYRMSGVAAVRAGEVCGFVTTVVLPASLALGTVHSVRDLYVAPAHRRSGVARALLAHVVASAQVAGALRISLQTETDNHAARSLYADLGFQPVTGLELLNLALPRSD